MALTAWSAWPASWGRGRGHVLLPLLLALLAASPEPTPQGGSPPLPADEAVRQIVEGGMDAYGLVIDGDLDLRPAGRVERLLRCRDCTVLGSVNAADVAFGGAVDLTGLQVRGGLDLHGARLEDAFLLQGSQRRQARIGGPVDLDLVTFADVAGFDGTSFEGRVAAQNLEVGAAASFSGTQFAEGAFFDHATFADGVNFSGGTFHGEARFTRVRFIGAASFQQRRFEDRATFTGSTFEGRADFTLAQFRGPARLDGTAFEDGATFRVVQALAPITFQQSRAGGPLDFQGSAFQDVVSLAGLATSDTLHLRDVTLADDDGLHMEPMFATALLMDVPTVQKIPSTGGQALALAALEQTAKARGDLRLANDARYALLALLSHDQQGLAWLLDRVFYRTVSGYLVRPLHPLLVLGLVLLLAAAARAVPRWRAARRRVVDIDVGEGWRGRWARVDRALAPMLAGINESMSRTFRRGAAREDDADAETPPLRTSARAVESTVYKVLLVVLVITLGNSNGTIREIIDALRG